MPLTKKGKEIMGSMTNQYGAKKGKQVFYASSNKGTIKGDHAKRGGTIKKMKGGKVNANSR